MVNIEVQKFPKTEAEPDGSASEGALSGGLMKN